jgi:hypothetical protein
MPRTDRFRGVGPPEADPSKETLEHFERFCYTLISPDTGERFRLRDFQLGPLEDFFAGGADAEFPTQLWEWPTGMGKSTLNGAIVLHHATYVVRRPRVFVVGGEFVHARNTLDAATGFVNESKRRNGILGRWWESQEIHGGRIIPLWLDDPDLGIFARSAGRTVERKGGSSVEGKDPTLIVVEELHRHQDGGAAVSTLVTKTVKSGARGRTVKALIGSTAGTDRESALGRMETEVLDEEHGAEVLRDLRPGEYYVRALSADRETVAHIWAVPDRIQPPAAIRPTEKELNAYMAEVKKANPADWITVRGLKRIWKSLTRAGKWMFLRQNCNQWVASGIAAIDKAMWAMCGKHGIQIPTGQGWKVVIGLDRASKWDSTAIVPVGKPPNGGKLRTAGAVILESPRDNTRRRTRDVGVILEMMLQKWPDATVAFDRAQGGGDVAEELEEEHGIKIVDHSQGVPFDLASMRLGEMVEGQKIEHDRNEKLTAQVCAAVMRFVAGGKRWRGEAPDNEVLVDGFDALAMAVNVLEDPGTDKSKPDLDPGDFRVEVI